jgi:UPF0755 protein
MRRVFLTLLLLVVLAAGVAVVAAGWLYLRLQQPYQGYAGEEQFVDIPPGSGVTTIADRLVEAGVIRNRLEFRLAVWWTGSGRRLQAGEYRFDQPMRATQVLGKLARGEVYLRLITFPEGLRLTEMARLFEERGFGTAEAFLEAARDPSPIAALDPDAPDLEGYLFPNTYALPRTATARQLVRLMVRNFEQAFTPDLREATDARGLSVREVVALASLVEKETGLAEERALVSAVFNNRLRLGMRLQCDPTVIYALEQAGIWDGNITRAGLAIDSPYNTYRYAGLPPGPIAAPGRAALEAALQPADADYMYFVSRNDGSHVFSRTLQEHNRAVYEHQILYHRERRLRERAEQQGREH